LFQLLLLTSLIYLLILIFLFSGVFFNIDLTAFAGNNIGGVPNSITIIMRIMPSICPPINNTRLELLKLY
jgi:hypothetical protein